MDLLRNSIKCRHVLFSKVFTRKFSSKKPYQEISIPVPWGEIRGKWWGPTDSRPILALHGWQDNCGSFDKLIPLLNNNIGFLALDMPGHGYSTRLPAGLYYHYTSYILTLKFIKEYLGWPKLSLMGHSMSGRISYTYTMMYPQQVDFLVCLDSLHPWVINHIGYTSERIETCFKNNKFVDTNPKEPPSYSLEEIKQKVHEPNDGSVNLDSAQYIMERGIEPSKLHPGKYYFTRDPRLKSEDLCLFPQSEILESTVNITCPVFVAKPKLSSYYEHKECFYQVLNILKKSSRDLNFHYVEGTHHAHLNNPEELAGLLCMFFQKHNIEDRSIGGLKEEMIITEEQDFRLKKRLY